MSATQRRGRLATCLLSLVLVFAELAAGCSGSAISDGAGQSGGGTGAGAGRVGVGGASIVNPQGGASPSVGGASPSAGGASPNNPNPDGGAQSNGGSSSGGSSSAGGSPGCVTGAACTCGALSGVTQCAGAVSACVCPPAEQCVVSDGAPCFAPCGGDPFGAWVLETACYATVNVDNGGGCKSVTVGTPGTSDLRMRILDGGALEVYGSEVWSMTSRVSLACGVSSTVSCPALFFSPKALLFSSESAVGCQASECGACDCKSAENRPVPNFSLDRWSRTELALSLGNVTVPYCVQGDELWIGGGSDPHAPKVSYKFKKQSCAGTPASCASRTADQCEAGASGCTLGLCKATALGSAARCAEASNQSDCAVLQNCAWDPAPCSGESAASCEFQSCLVDPGCSFGPPVEKCAGESDCFSRDTSDCADLGCAVELCQPDASDQVDCTLLKSAADCAKAPGCVVGGASAATVCTGQALCTEQTDTPTCVKLGCIDAPTCQGDQTPCSALSLTDCDRIPGCRREW